ncbi:MAG: hypothetical protein K2X11_11185 [Acetobacteraceae bacterium]|nr:hypothetical protein [Acetobacteraceae bacterium]
MPILADSRAVAATRRPVNANGVPIHTTTFVGTNWTVRGPDSPPPPEPGSFYPMAFLVEQPPGSVVTSHFHQADQFQVVVAGGGTLGRHPVRPVTVHYTNAHTAYGPITAGEDGLHYFTLRNGYDPGARYVATAAAELKAVPNREPWQTTTEPVTPGDGTPGAEPLLEPRADGLGAWRHVVEAGAALRGPDPSGGKGQFWLVLRGALDGLPPLSLLFVGPDEPALEASAGPEGAEVLVMQYPRRGAIARAA